MPFLLLSPGWGTVLVLLDVALSIMSVILYIVGTYFPTSVSEAQLLLQNPC